LRQDGFVVTARALVKEIASFLRDSTPERKRRRYGDVEYDWENHVDTTSATVTFRDRLLGLFHSPYQPTEPILFREMMSGVIERAESSGTTTRIAVTEYSFVDLGCGKGRALLMASEYPFRRILGVELLPELSRIAQENIRKFKSDSQKCCAIEVICGDARLFQFLPEPAIFYLFNPFPKGVLEAVIGNLGHSLEETPRPVFVLYHNPLLESVLSRSPKLKKVRGTHQYVIYESHPQA